MDARIIKQPDITRNAPEWNRITFTDNDVWTGNKGFYFFKKDVMRDILNRCCGAWETIHYFIWP